MRKALITMIIVLTALILAIVMFVVGMQLTSEKNVSDTGGKEGASSLSDKVESENSKDESDKPAAAPLDPDYDPLEEPETKEEPKPEPEPEPEPEQKPDSNSQTTYRDYPANSNEWYRVRTSAGSDGKQDGAFKSFANAKSHADTLKAQGYKVYDNNMRCIYTP